MILEAEDEDFAALIRGAPPRDLRLADGGLETPKVLEMLRRLANTVRGQFAPAAWMFVEDDEVVGLCSIKALAGRGVIEIGYGVAASRRNRGIGGRGVAEVLAWARTDGRVSSVRAETALDNPPSRRVLERNGFQITGRRTDADEGEVICWRRSVQL